MALNLWNIIRDFFVEYVFGGTLSNGYFNITGFLGYFTEYYDDSLIGSGEYTDTFLLGIGNSIAGNGGSGGAPSTLYISMGDWLSTTATIITLIGLFIGISTFIIKLVKWISNTIAMR